MRLVLSYCKYCDGTFHETTEVCPFCNKPITEKIVMDDGFEDPYDDIKECEGRRYRTGGIACDMCPFCHGTRDWCPVVD